MNILIQGVGRTGTTALFYAIRHALSGTVAELFEPPGEELRRALELSPQPDHILAKMLLRESVPAPYERFQKIIMTVRDPRDTLVSRLLYIVWQSDFCLDDPTTEAYLTLLRAKERYPKGISLMALFSTFSAFQRDHPYREYLQVLGGLHRQEELLATRPDFFIVRYEDFVDGKVESLRGYLDGLAIGRGVNVAPEVTRVTRSKAHGDWRHWFTQEDVAFFRPMLAARMGALGYADDWELADSPTIDPRYGSEYVARLIAERRARIQDHRPFAPTSHAELLTLTPEMLSRLTQAAQLPITVAPTNIDSRQGWNFSSSMDPQYLIHWEGPPILGDVIWGFYFDAESVNETAVLYMDFGDGLSESMSVVLPARRGHNLVATRFHKPVVGLRLDPVNSARGFLLRDLRLFLL
jgi:hypothetical protein